MIMDTKKSSKRHQHSRTRVRWPVSVFASPNQFEAKTEYISPEGVLLSCRETPPLEGDFDLLIKAPNRYPMKVTAKLVWTEFGICEDGRQQLGADVKFITISDKDRQFLKDLITRHYLVKTGRMTGRAGRIGEITAEDAKASTPSEDLVSGSSECDAVPVTLRARVHMSDLARALGTDFETLKELNPKILSYYLPTGSYSLNVPYGTGFKVASVVTQLNRNASRRKPNSPGDYYVVRAGDNLRNIARKTGVSMLNLARFNGIHGSALKVGQRLRLSRGGK
jgi:LysM repeat protein